MFQAIDDDFISCPIPSIPKDGNSEKFDFIIKMAQHGQISSDIAKLLSSAKARRDSPRTTMRHMQDLEARLVSWRESLNPMYRARAPFNVALPQGKQLFRMLFLHFSYHISIIAIHGVFCYPWDRPDFQGDKSPEIRSQIQMSTEAVGESSRQMIMGLQRLETTVTLPLWYVSLSGVCSNSSPYFYKVVHLYNVCSLLNDQIGLTENRLTFYYPLAGLVNLIIYLLKNPQSPSVAADMSLMDIVVGHFGYLEFVSSSVMMFPFPREITSYTRRLVEKANKRPSQGVGGPSTHVPSTTGASGGIGPPDIVKPNWALPLQSLDEVRFPPFPIYLPLITLSSIDMGLDNSANRVKRISSSSLRTWITCFSTWRTCFPSGPLFPRAPRLS
jgi:hypothetical protein